MAQSADRSLLLGILALQNDLVTRDQLIEAMNAWAEAKDRPLGEILCERGALDREHRRLTRRSTRTAKVTRIQAAVDKHLADLLADGAVGVAECYGFRVARLGVLGVLCGQRMSDHIPSLARPCQPAGRG